MLECYFNSRLRHINNVSPLYKSYLLVHNSEFFSCVIIIHIADLQYQRLAVKKLRYFISIFNIEDNLVSEQDEVNPH